jgi:hypothetical protein
MSQLQSVEIQVTKRLGKEGKLLAAKTQLKKHEEVA